MASNLTLVTVIGRSKCQTFVISPGSVGRWERCFSPCFFLLLTTSSSDFYASGEHVSKHLWRDRGLYFYDTARRLFGLLCCLSGIFIHCSQVIFLPVPVGCFAVALWRRGAEVGALATIKQCSAILVRTIFLIVTYTGDSVAAACLDHQKRVKQGRREIWASKHTLLKSFDDIVPNVTWKAAGQQREIKYYSLLEYTHVCHGCSHFYP